MPIPRVESFTDDGSGIITLKGPISNRTEAVFVDGPVLSRAGYSLSLDQKTITIAAPRSGASVIVSYSEADS